MKTSHYPNTTYLRHLASSAGVIMKENFGLGMARTTKEDRTPLTESDTAINDLVTSSIARDYPHVRVVGEEGNYEVDGAEYTVLCDPIDGTIPFCHGIPIASFVISVIRGDQPLVSVISDPFWDRTWHATHGEGAYLNDQPVRVSTMDTIEKAYACIIWWSTGADNYYMHDAVGKMLDRKLIIMDPMTLAYCGGLLASGELDATIYPNTKGWETAAMQLLAEEAGGKVTDIHGNPMRYGKDGQINGHIITNGLIHDDLVEIIASCQR